MSDFNYFLNRQGPRGMQGEKGEKGNDGNTPTFYAGVDSGTQYTLIIDMGDGNTFETSNLMPTFVNTGGTYLRYDTVNNRYVSAQADMADLSGNVGEVKLATTTSVANETVQDSDAVSYELFRQSGGGGGGTSFIPGTGLELTNADVLNVKIDNNTITTNASGQLVANGGGSTTYTAGTGIDITNNTISIDNATLGTINSAVQPDDLGDLAGKDSVDYTTDVANKPTIGAGVITFTQGSTVLGTIDVNQTTPTTINIPSSGGGGGGSTYAPGNGIDISSSDVISAKVDNSTIGFTAGGELELKATIPTDTSDLTNGAGYITSSALSGYATETWVTNQGYTTNTGTVTSVNNIQPVNGNVTINIPTVPTNVSAFTNDAGYLTSHQSLAGYVPTSRTINLKPLTSDITLTASDIGALPSSTVIPSKTSDLTNDSGYITTSSLPGLATTSSAGLVQPDGTTITINNGIISSAGGSSTDVQVNGTSITSSGVANIVTEGTYDASTNKIATMDDVPTNCISGSEVLSPLEYTTSIIGVQKFNYTGSTGVVPYDNSYGVNKNPPSTAFQYISELANGVNFITTAYLAAGNSEDKVQSIINLGTYSNGTFTTIIPVSINSYYDYIVLNDDSYNELCKFYLSGYPQRNDAYEANNKTVFCLSYDSSLQSITAAYSTPDSSNNNRRVYGSLNNVNSTSYPDLVTKLGQCTHIQVAFVNNASNATVTSMNIDNMVLTNPSTSYVSSLNTSDVDCLMDAVAVDTNLYTSTVTNHNLVLNYDSSTLDVDNGALKVKDNTFITESSLQTVHCIVETYQNGTSWYRLYDDGWVEQGGETPGNTNAMITINLLKEMSDGQYYPTINRIGTSTDSANVDRSWDVALNRTATTFQCWDLYGTYKACWEVKGYAAQI